MSARLRSAGIGIVYGRTKQRDARGNIHVTLDMTRPFHVRMTLDQIRSNRAEYKGQLTNDVRKCLFHTHDIHGELLVDVGPWTRIVAPDGSVWDMAAPPALVGVRRSTKHWVAEVKSRPPSNLEGVVDRT